MSYKDTVLPIIRETRAISLPGWGASDIVNMKSDHPADIVTKADRAIEEFLRAKLAELYPDIPFVGEEDGGDRTARAFWLVDPIDGTGHYMRGLPFCTTMLALVEDSAVVFAAIYDFITDTMYWAEKGGGAYRNDTRIHVSDRDLAEGYVAVEIGVTKGRNMELLGMLEEKAGYMHTVSSGWDFAMVASGKIEGRIMIDPWGKDYDFVPGSLIVAEAGGIVRNIGSETYDYKNLNLIAANPKVHAQLTLFLK